MDFINENGKINCIRQKSTKKNTTQKSLIVASFNEDINTVPPHVSAALSPEESEQLTQWLNDRANLQKRMDSAPAEQTILDALPALFQETIDALEKVEKLNFNLFNSIKQNLLEIDSILNRFHPIIEEESLKLNKMQGNEILKEQLDMIKRKL